MEDKANLPFMAELQAIKPKWGWLLLVALLLIAGGIYLISYAAYTSIITVMIFGVFLLLSGGFHLVSALWSFRTRGFFLSLVMSLLYIFAGSYIIAQPLSATITLTMVMAIFFMISGLFRIITAFSFRGAPSWGWVLFSGVITLLLGIMIWAHWPVSGLWVIGLFVGIDILFAGWTLLMVALAARSA